MHYSALIKCDHLNGEGIRVSLWCSGCTMNCKGCHSKELQNFRFGSLFTPHVEAELLEALDKPYINGLSILGGHALELQNYATIFRLCSTVKQYFPDKTIWLWSGYTLEEIQQHLTYSGILSTIDVLVDGKFVEELKDTTLQWCGSRNQRVLYKGKDF